MLSPPIFLYIVLIILLIPIAFLERAANFDFSYTYVVIVSLSVTANSSLALKSPWFQFYSCCFWHILKVLLLVFVSVVISNYSA